MVTFTFFTACPRTLTELVTMENVPGLMERTIFKDFIKVLEKANYHLSYGVVDCEDYGVPQHRRRLVMLASKLGPIEILTPSELGEKPLHGPRSHRLPAAAECREHSRRRSVASMFFPLANESSPHRGLASGSHMAGLGGRSCRRLS